MSKPEHKGRGLRMIVLAIIVMWLLTLANSDIHASHDAAAAEHPCAVGK